MCSLLQFEWTVNYDVLSTPCCQILPELFRYSVKDPIIIYNVFTTNAVSSPSGN